MIGTYVFLIFFLQKLAFWYIKIVQFSQRFWRGGRINSDYLYAVNLKKIISGQHYRQIRRREDKFSQVTFLIQRKLWFWLFSWQCQYWLDDKRANYCQWLWSIISWGISLREVIFSRPVICQRLSFSTLIFQIRDGN